MVRMRGKAALLPLFLSLALVAAACGDDGDSGSDGDGGGGGGGDLSGTVRLDGSSTVAPLSEVAAELFMGENGGVQVTVATSGTSGGFEKFCNGETDMNDASREIKDEEIEACEANEIGWDGIQVANDALSLVVHPDNPLECITVEQASQIWTDGSSVGSWGDVDGLDIPEDFGGEQLTPVGPGTDSGTFDYFTEAINGEEGVIRNDYINIGEDDQRAVETVSTDVGAIGYIPFSFTEEAGDSVKPLQVDGGDGCVEGTLETVQDGTYTPLGRGLFVYASDTALTRAEVLAFMEFYVENAPEIAETAGFIPLTDEQIAEQQAKIEELTS